MKGPFLWVILVVSVFGMINSSPLNFKEMIQKITGENALIYFNRYGCYCGQDGKGKPRDRLDMCCYNLDCCYESIYMHTCHSLIHHYNFTIADNDVLCENEENSCPRHVCECDREASLCFRRESHTNNKFFHHYPTVLCKEATPKCPHAEGAA